MCIRHYPTESDGKRQMPLYVGPSSLPVRGTFSLPRPPLSESRDGNQTKPDESGRNRTDPLASTLCNDPWRHERIRNQQPASTDLNPDDYRRPCPSVAVRVRPFLSDAKRRKPTCALTFRTPYWIRQHVEKSLQQATLRNFK